MSSEEIVMDNTSTRFETTEEQTTARGAPTRAKRIERILVPVDYSDTSRSALEYAAWLGRTLGAELDVVHVWDRPAFVSGEVMVRERDGCSRGLGELILEGAEREMND